MRTSVEARIRKDRISRNNYASAYLQIIINSKRTTLPLQISWPVDSFDQKKGLFLPRFRGDQEANDLNLHVQKEKSKVNDILIFYRHSDFELTIEQFHRDYHRYGARKDFLIWMEFDIEDRSATNRISIQTFKNAQSALRKIKSWRDKILFSELDKKLMEELDGWLKNDGLKVNGRWSILKIVKTYAARASKEGIAVNMESIREFKLPRVQSKIIYLEPQHLAKLKRYYASEEITHPHKRVLGHFLFSCVTGLRFSDIMRISWKEIQDDILVFEPFKTRAIEKIVKIPLIDEAFEYIHNEKGLLFNCMQEQPTNRMLKDIALKCGIRKNLTTHVARHTFATEFLRRGGHIEVLQQLLGHSKISTTMIYIHVDESRLRDQMALMQ